MSGPRFDETIRGQRFYDGYVPKFIKSLEALADNVGRLAEVQAKAPAAPAVAGRKIMLLPSKDTDDFMAILTPEGMEDAAAKAIAEEVLAGLEEADREGQDDPDYQEWQGNDYLDALVARGFLKLEMLGGPTWDRSE